MRLSVALSALLLLGVSHASAAVLIKVDKTTQTMQVDVDGAPRWTWPVSTGTTDGHRTPSGTFSALWLDEKHASSKYENAPMPHSVFFTKLGHAIHGSNDVGHLGQPASHGCVRLLRANAKKLFELVDHRKAETTIVIQGEEPLPAGKAKPKAMAHRSVHDIGHAVDDDNAREASSPESYEVRYYRDRMEPGEY